MIGDLASIHEAKHTYRSSKYNWTGRPKFATVFGLVFATASAAFLPPSEQALREVEHLTGLELIEYINKAQNLFTVSSSAHFAQHPDDFKRRLMGSEYVTVPAELRVNEKTHDDINDASIPASFDARTHWPQCPSILTIRDQSSCEETVSVPHGYYKELSLGCSHDHSIREVVDSDIQSKHHDGPQISGAGCKPYPFPPCEHRGKADHYDPCPSHVEPTNACEHSCQDGYPLSYTNDKHFGATAYIVSKKMTDIQKEIMTNGPVEVSYNVYEDFGSYTGGIYVHTAGALRGGHAVKMIGWGTENGVPYWICSNSWNTDWGEKGFFRIIRGIDECGIESGVVAGEPKL
ncbi:papain family cysteine protease [Teladorsagia circumcincta]|uniref:Papain family cysteine protease n=1 Tax=Teladorsagia circumcincta TaxID=45464 RepID=A0A2G9U3E3_TELCI|nr:papain family cysteine protease [Teladorsagia circumcincta]